MLNFFRRAKAISKTRFLSPDSQIYFGKNVLIFIEPGASIEVAGKVTVGFPLPGHLPFPANCRTVLSLKRGAKLIFGGDVAIANGTGLYVDENAVLEFKGGNSVAHNSLLLCKQLISMADRGH